MRMEDADRRFLAGDFGVRRQELVGVEVTREGEVRSRKDNTLGGVAGGAEPVGGEDAIGTGKLRVLEPSGLTRLLGDQCTFGNEDR